METFAKFVLTPEKISDLLPKKIYKKYLSVINRDEKMDMTTADAVAHAMKAWALLNGATHYTHWFQPMTGKTAEKHDAFLEIDEKGKSLLRFSGKQLIKSEPDASSFPSGGSRSTFEARGYTAWDPQSPAFLMTGPRKMILCIPSVFISYNGEALDMKTPLLRSMKSLDKAAQKLMSLIDPEKKINKIKPYIGAEQEYFLVKKDKIKNRPDILLTGRTLIGAHVARGQELEDHYFGSIDRNILDIMQHAEKELYALGVPCKTRHNEVAPQQFELAPIYEEASIAADHNQLIMEVLKESADQHGYKLLFHEKPFNNLNGSGKHCNWSLITDDGTNLFAPGKNYKDNLRFLVFIMIFVKAIRDNSALLRASVASAGNDHRLGANEAPPAIMSVFLGTGITDIIKKICSGNKTQGLNISKMDLGISYLPHILKDNTDRNRTAPMAFTGNKMEFRAPGSSDSISLPVTIINAAMTDTIDSVCSLVKSLAIDNSSDECLLKTIKILAEETEDIRFDGNCYSPDWLKNAIEKGLLELKTTPEAVKSFFDEKLTRFLTDNGVYSKNELIYRGNAALERYIKIIDIEAHVLCDMILSEILPGADKSISLSGDALSKIKSSVSKTLNTPEDKRFSLYEKRFEYIFTTTSDLYSKTTKLQIKRDELKKIDDIKKASMYCVHQIIPAIKEVRALCDSLEQFISSKHWPYPKYWEILF